MPVNLQQVGGGGGSSPSLPKITSYNSQSTAGIGLNYVAGSAFSGSTLSNSSAESDLLTVTLPANTFSTGTVLRCRGLAIATNSSGAGVTFYETVQINSTSIGTPGTFTVGNGATGQGFPLDVDIFCTSAGVSGSLTAVGMYNATSLTTLVSVTLSNVFTGTFDTTSTITLHFRGKMGTASPNATFTGQYFICTVAN